MRYFIGLAAALSCGVLGVADGGEPMLLEAPPTKIAMFKNGVGIVTHDVELGETPDENNVFRFDQLPRATWGSLWLTASEGVTLDRVRAREATYLRPVSPRELEEALRRQFGDTARITLSSDELAGLDVMRSATGPVLDFAVDLADDAPDGPEPRVGLTYLTHGIAWSPSVVIDLIDDDTARVTAKAVVINDLMDLNGVDLEFIAGYPNLKFSTAWSPMSLEPLPQLLAALRQSPQFDLTSALSNTMLQQRVSYESGDFGGAGGGMAFPTGSIDGQDAGDLYFYQLDDVTLARGERGYFPLFGLGAPYRSIHTWDVGSFVDPDGNYRQEQAEAPRVVWHELELKNTGDQPWTTAAALSRRDGRVMGQDTMFYTPPGGTTRVKTTQAVAVEADAREVETAREPDAAKINRSTYSKITVRGTLSVTNHKSEPITICITKNLTGELIEAGGDPTVSKPARLNAGVNPQTQLVWELEVPPGKDAAVELTYDYSFYSR